MEATAGPGAVGSGGADALPGVGWFVVWWPGCGAAGAVGWRQGAGKRPGTGTQQLGFGG
jgi:hypothetical protein